MEEEKKIGAIPHVNVNTAWGPKEYGILVTEYRTIFALLKESHVMTGALLGGGFGAGLAHAMAKERVVDLENTPPEYLACYKDSICVPHNSLDNVRFKKSMGTHKMLLKYRNEKGKKQKLDIVLMPTPEYLKRLKSSGVKPKEAREQYARNVQEVYRRALPLGVSTHTEWFE